MADRLVVNSEVYDLARDPQTGARAFSVTTRASQPGDPGGMDYADFTLWGPDLQSREDNGYLGPEYHDGTDGRFENVDTLGPELNTITLSTYDSAVHSADLLGSSFILGGSAGYLGGAVTVANAEKQAQIKAGGVTYAYIQRGQIPAKVRLSDFTLMPNPPTFSVPATDVIATRAAAAATRNEVSFALGDGAAWQTLKEDNVGATDAWGANVDSAVATKFGQAPDRVIVLTGRDIKGNILTGSVTMADPNLNTVATADNIDLVYTGFGLDGNTWIGGSDRGPLTIDPDTGDIVPIIPEIDRNIENCRVMGTWYPLGLLLPLRSGYRYSKSLQGQSWGVERFLTNSSPVRGYPTGGAGSTSWYVHMLYDAIAGDTWIIASRPRQFTDRHPHPVSHYVIGHLSGQVSRYVDYVGYANGERTLPAWMFGRGSDAGYFLDGRTPRFIDDTSYRYTTAGSTYTAEKLLETPVDIEAVEFTAANLAAGRTVTPNLSGDGGATYQALAAQTVSGRKRVLAVSGGAPLATLQGLSRLKLRMDYATNSATSAPQVVSAVRVYWRWRPAEVNDYTWSLVLRDDDTAKTPKDMQDALIAAWGRAPVSVEEDQDDASYYVRVNHVQVREVTYDPRDPLSGANTGSWRVADVQATEWRVA